MKNNTLEILKQELSQQLIKAGSSLDEMEKELANKAISEKTAGVLEALKSFFTGTFDAGLAAGKFGLEALPAIGVGGGVALGGGAYALDKHLSGQDKKHNEKQQLIDKYKELTERVKGDHGLHPAPMTLQNPS